MSDYTDTSTKLEDALPRGSIVGNLCSTLRAVSVDDAHRVAFEVRGIEAKREGLNRTVGDTCEGQPDGRAVEAYRETVHRRDG